MAVGHNAIDKNAGTLLNCHLKSTSKEDKGQHSYLRTIHSAFNAWSVLSMVIDGVAIVGMIGSRRVNCKPNNWTAKRSDVIMRMCQIFRNWIHSANVWVLCWKTLCVQCRQTAVTAMRMKLVKVNEFTLKSLRSTHVSRVHLDGTAPHRGCWGNQTKQRR